MPVVHPQPPDGGWGWMVVLAAFFQSALVFGVIRSFGVFFMEFVGYFGELAGQVSWITSIGIAVQQFASPVGSALSTQYGARPVVMAGGVLSGLGMFLASFATSLTHLYLSIGLLSGFGWALVFTPSVASVARYFKKRRTFATGLAFTGVGLSSFAFSPLFQLLVDTYAWRGALLVVAGMSFNLVVCGALIRPLTLKEDLAGAGDPGGSCLGKLSTLFGLPLLFHWPFMRFVLAVTLINTGYFIPYVHLVARARELGFDEYQAAFLMSVAAVADLCGRLLSGWLADCRVFNLSHILVAWTSLTGISLALLPLGRSYPLLMAIGICYGFFSGALTPVVFSILPEIVGIRQIFGSMGLLQMMESIGGLLGAPFSGWLRDTTGDYTASFLAAGAFLLSGSLVLVTLPNFFSCLGSSPPACHGTKVEAGAEPAALTPASGELSSQDRDWPARSQDLREPA
ncbi:unnamed protein product [Lepidochelys olivacea]